MGPKKSQFLLAKNTLSIPVTIRLNTYVNLLVLHNRKNHNVYFWQCVCTNIGRPEVVRNHQQHFLLPLLLQSISFHQTQSINWPMRALPILKTCIPSPVEIFLRHEGNEWLSLQKNCHPFRCEEILTAVDWVKYSVGVQKDKFFLQLSTQ